MADNNVELSTLGSVIKQAYEGQPNTNAFTDDEKSKLAATEILTSSEKEKLEETLVFTQGEKDKLEETEVFTEAEKDKLSSIQIGARIVPGIRLAAIGTSLVQQCVSANVSERRVSYGSRSWLNFAIGYSGKVATSPIWYDPTVVPGWEPSGTPGATRGFEGLNFGVSGQFLSQIISRLPRIKEIYADSFDVIIVDGGTNDMSGQTKEYIHEKRVEIAEFFVAMGKFVILLPILSRANDQWISTYRAKANWVNNKTREYALNNPYVTVYDWNNGWVNCNDADGQPITSEDGTHFNTAAAESVGYNLGLWLKNFFPGGNAPVYSPGDKFDSTNNPLGNILLNPFCLGTAGTNGNGSSGVVCNNMRVERSVGSSVSVVCSKETRPNNKGEFQVLTFSLGGTAGETFYFRTAPADISNVLAGKWAKISCIIETNNSDAILGLTLSAIDMNGTDAPTITTFDPRTVSSVIQPWAARERKDFYLESPYIKFPDDSTTVRFRLQIIIKGDATIAPVIKVGELEFRQYEDPRPEGLK